MVIRPRHTRHILSPHVVRALLWLFFATLSAILMLQLRGFDSALRIEGAPGGIVGYVRSVSYSPDPNNGTAQVLAEWLG